MKDLPWPKRSPWVTAGCGKYTYLKKNRRFVGCIACWCIRRRYIYNIYMQMFNYYIFYIEYTYIYIWVYTYIYDMYIIYISHSAFGVNCMYLMLLYISIFQIGQKITDPGLGCWLRIHPSYIPARRDTGRKWHENWILNAQVYSNVIVMSTVHDTKNLVLYLLYFT